MDYDGVNIVITGAHNESGGKDGISSAVGDEHAVTRLEWGLLLGFRYVPCTCWIVFPFL